VRRPADLRRYTLIHVYWPPSFRNPPTWRRWFAAARSRQNEALALGEVKQVRFSEELPAYEAVIAGQGVGLLSDVLVEAELTSGALVKALDLQLQGYGFYISHTPDHPRQRLIEAFQAWLRSFT
jgi:LysR family glycine cleavage system transcriptional activator